MTEDKALKRSIRTRMTKTGESYTAARRHIVKSKESAARLDVDLGQSDETILRSSGKTWDEWFAILDAWGAMERTHTEIARFVNEAHHVSGWWSQAVTVGYERGRGMRSVNQGSKGGFSVGVSKTVPVGVTKLSEEFTETRKRNRWIETGTLRTRTSTSKAAHFDFRDESRVHVYFESKGRGKATVHVMHEKLSDKKAVEEMRSFWKEQLARLAERVAK